MTSLKELRPDIDWDHDVDRVAVLLGPFRSKSLNPEAWQHKMTFWTDSIQKWMTTSKTDKLPFSLLDLEQEFTIGTRKPHCLEEVLSEMLQTDQIVSVDNLKGELDKKNANSWTSWSWQVLKKSSSNLLSQPVQGQMYVSRKKLQQQSEKVHKRLSSDENMKKFANNAFVQVNKEEDQLIMDNLRGQKLVQVLTMPSGKCYVKLSPDAFDELDKAFLSLNESCDQLKVDIAQLDVKMNSSRSDIKELMRNKSSRSRAKMVLRQLKRLDRQVERKSWMLDNLDSLLHQLETSVDNKSAIKCLQVGRSALKKELQLTPSSDKAFDLMQDIKNLIEETEEVSEALANNEEDDDDASLNEELDRLLKTSCDDDDVIDKMQTLAVHDEELINKKDKGKKLVYS